MYAIVRLRGGVNTRPEIRDTLRMLHLDRVNHCVVVREDEHYLGMIRKVKDFVAWGHIDAATLKLLLEKRGRLSGNKRLTEQLIKESLGFGSMSDLAAAIHSGQTGLKELGIKPVFRLHPPRKGHRGIKKTAAEGGELGFHSAMADLIQKMR